MIAIKHAYTTAKSTKNGLLKIRCIAVIVNQDWFALTSI